MTSKERFQLVLESDVSLATIVRWDRGKTVNQAIDDVEHHRVMKAVIDPHKK